MRRDAIIVQALGLLAGMLSIAAFAPHAWAVYNSKQHCVKKPELWTYFVFALSLLTWGVYACIRADWPLAIATLLQLALMLYVCTCIVCASQSPNRPSSVLHTGHHGVETEEIFCQDDFDMKEFCAHDEDLPPPR
jgi:uncharacterized protein with PQ loop repeat